MSHVSRLSPNLRRTLGFLISVARRATVIVVLLGLAYLLTMPVHS
jgi:hypothetical protein